jgi:hypothetical protein
VVGFFFQNRFLKESDPKLCSRGYDAAYLGPPDEPLEEDAESYDAWYESHYDQREWDDSEA